MNERSSLSAVALTPISWAKRLWARKGFRSFAKNIAVVLIVFLGVTLWQGRHLLSSGTPAPPLALRGLDGALTNIKDDLGRRVVLYFFAPWCSVCDASASNLETLRRWRPENDVRIYLVALDYEDTESVRAFASRNNITLPVLLGDETVQRDYHVGVYPTYYVVDTSGQIRGRSTGYSTFVGLLARTFTR
jgi:peroxiredoxin